MRTISNGIQLKICPIDIIDPNLYGGGQICPPPPPRKFLCYSSKIVGTRLMKHCDLYCQPITHHLVYLLVERDHVAMVIRFLTLFQPGGGGIHPPSVQVFPSPSPQKSTDRFQTF